MYIILCILDNNNSKYSFKNGGNRDEVGEFHHI